MLFPFSFSFLEKYSIYFIILPKLYDYYSLYTLIILPELQIFLKLELNVHPFHRVLVQLHLNCIL